MTVDGLPRPIIDSAPELVELYDVAWSLAADHVTERAGAPASPYMDEGFDPDTVWIWDTCLMAHFTKYAPDRFPGIESLANFYGPLYLGRQSPLTIHHADNPPLFAWSELEYLRHTGDLERVRAVLASGVLQRHFEWFDSAQPGEVPRGSRIPVGIQRTGDGYRWNGVSSGMDNTPRAPQGDEVGTWGDLYWLDAMAQQALTALSLAQLHRAVEDVDGATLWMERHAQLIRWLNEVHWSPVEHCYLDRLEQPGLPFSSVVTPASFWPLLAQAATARQAEAMVVRLTDPDGLGGPVPFPSVERRHPDFRGTGHYWRGGVWIPMAYMVTRAISSYGHHALAHRLTMTLLASMARTYQEFTPHTIWETYSPTRPRPATDKDDVTLVRPDFCGWSALGPIAMLIEHGLGISVDALTASVTWHRHLGGRHGIERLRCGDATLSMVTEHGSVSGHSSGPLTLVVDGFPHLVDGDFAFDAEDE